MQRNAERIKRMRSRSRLCHASANRASNLMGTHCAAASLRQTPTLRKQSLIRKVNLHARCWRACTGCAGG